MSAETCICCGQTWPGRGTIRVDGGRMHFNCWDDHHSHPIENPWPDDHECALTPGPDGEGVRQGYDRASN